MGTFFAQEWSGDPFILFGIDHLAIILFFILLNLSFFWLRKLKDTKSGSYLRIGLAVVLLLFEISWQAWNIYIGKWTIQDHLPLHMCSLFLFINAAMMISRNQVLYDLSYCLGIGSGLMAFLTPDPGPYGLWHFVPVQTIFGHGLLVSLTIYMTIVEGFRPTWKSIPRAFIFGLAALLFSYFVNLVLGSNYIFTSGKPGSASLLDLLGPYPWYLLSMVGVGLMVMILMVSPWEYWNWRKKKQQRSVIAH
jgi:hypothetical integral membrane protein (TIGR02206 family)